MQASARRPSVVGSVPRLRPTRRGGRVLGHPALFARYAPRIRRDGARGPDPCWLRSRACPGRGMLGCVRPVSHGGPSPRHTTERVAPDTPSGSPLRISCSARRRCTPSATIARLSPPSRTESPSMNDEEQVPQAGTPAAPADAGETPVEKLEALGVRGILWQLARDGQIIDVRCEMPQCYCFRGRRYFEPRSARIPIGSRRPTTIRDSRCTEVTSPPTTSGSRIGSATDVTTYGG